MANDARHAIVHRFDRKTLTLKIPDVFEQLKGTDVNFELTTSSTLQKLELPYRDNIVAKSRGIVFVTDSIDRPGCEPLVYINHDKNGDMATSILKDSFKFDTVELIENPSKQEVLDKLKELDDESEMFEQDHEPKTVLAIAVIWIGFKLREKDEP